MKVVAVSIALMSLAAVTSVEFSSAAYAKRHRHHSFSAAGAQAKVGLEKQTKTGGPSGGSTKAGGG